MKDRISIELIGLRWMGVHDEQKKERKRRTEPKVLNGISRGYYSLTSVTS